jgi:hypothetical protein
MRGPLRACAALLAGAALLAACTGEVTREPGRRSQPPQPPPTVPAGLAWRSLAPAPSKRTEVTAAAAGRSIYVMGGFLSDRTSVPTVEVYDTVADRWRRGPDLPVAVNHAMSTTLDGAVHLLGGYLGDGTPSRRAFRLDAGRWRALPDLPQGRGAGTAQALDGRIYVAGGVGPGGLARSMLVYERASDRWSVAPGPPTPREHLGGAAFDGRVYTVGGRAAGRGNLDAAEVYDVAAGTWSRLPALPTPRGGLAAAATANGLVVAVGGEGKATFEEAEAFDVRSGAWVSLPPLPTPRHGLGVVAVGSRLYTMSGGPKPGLFVAATAEAIDLGPLRP